MINDLEWLWRIGIMGLLAFMAKTLWYDNRRSIDSKQSQEMCKQMRDSCRELISVQLGFINNNLEKLNNKIYKNLEDLNKKIDQLNLSGGD